MQIYMSLILDTVSMISILHPFHQKGNKGVMRAIYREASREGYPISE
jgi:hypothetical protein